MSKMQEVKTINVEYTGYVLYTNPMQEKVSDMMRKAGMWKDGTYWYQRDEISFTADNRHTIKEFEDHFKESYEEAGGIVHEIKLWRSKQ